MTKLSNLEVVGATNYLSELDANFPIRSGTRVSRSKKALQQEAETIREAQQKVNEEFQKKNEEGEPLFDVFVPGEGPRELTQEEAQELSQEEDVDEASLRMSQKFTDAEARQEKLNQLMRDDSGLGEDDLHKILEEELDEVQEGFRGERISDVIAVIEQVVDLDETEKSELGDALDGVLNSGVSLSDLDTIEFLMPVA